MDRVKYILSTNKIIDDFIHPTKNVYNFSIFTKIVLININDIIWVRLDDITRYLSKYLQNYEEYICQIHPNNIKCLFQLADVKFWDSYTDVYIHETEFILLSTLAGLDWYNISNHIDVIRLKKASAILHNNMIKFNLQTFIKSCYNFDIVFNNNNNYIITLYHKIFSIKCNENNERYLFLLSRN